MILKFHQNKSPILIIDIDINKIVASYKLPLGKQDFFYFIYFMSFMHILSKRECM